MNTTDNTQRVRIGLFGTGWIIPLHAQAILEHPRAQLVAITNWRQDSMMKMAERYSIPGTTNQLAAAR